MGKSLSKGLFNFERVSRPCDIMKRAPLKFIAKIRTK